MFETNLRNHVDTDFGFDFGGVAFGAEGEGGFHSAIVVEGGFHSAIAVVMGFRSTGSRTKTIDAI
jgi:hypothetical protein